jgi:hypothetical protein
VPKRARERAELIVSSERKRLILGAEKVIVRVIGMLSQI